MRSSALALLLGIACCTGVVHSRCALAQGTVVRKTNYYAMTGSSIRHIHESLRQTRPWKDKSTHDGSTEWRIQWRANFNVEDGVCHCSSFDTTTTITITLPRWVVPTNTPVAVRAAWQQYLTALMQHEAGHADFALAAAAEMHKRIKEIESDADCAALKTRVHSECQAIIDSHRAREKEYDERTKHGATQGATLRRPRERTE
jgi:predicted secreted Zn-dependent protease